MPIQGEYKLNSEKNKRGQTQRYWKSAESEVSY